jgi:hypothetical protein
VVAAALDSTELAAETEVPTTLTIPVVRVEVASAASAARIMAQALNTQGKAATHLEAPEATLM